jgi:hypothetical protein
MRKILMILTDKKSIMPFLLIGLLWLIACEKYSYDPPTIDPGVQVSFQTDIQPLFTGKCIGCHGTGKNNPVLEAGSAFTSLTTGGYIKVSAPETSTLYKQITTGGGHTSILNDLQKQTILEWIKQGAKNN